MGLAGNVGWTRWASIGHKVGHKVDRPHLSCAQTRDDGRSGIEML